MKRNFLILGMSIAGLFLLNACSPNAETTSTSPVVLNPTAVLDTPNTEITSTSPVVLNPTVILDTPTPEVSCSSVTSEPTAAPDASSYFPAVSDADFSFGPADAPVTFLEYCDFQSSGCRSLSITVATIMKNRQDVRFVFRPFPLIGVDGMDKSDKAILAALAADKQEKFWTMYDLLFAKHDEWASLKPDKFNAWILEQAKGLDMDVSQLQAAINDPETTTRMMSMYDAAKKVGIPAVPLVLINGGLEPSYLLDYQSLSDTVGLIALGQKQFSQCPPFNVDATKKYIATIHTEKGDIVMQLFPDKAPLAVNSFVFLARAGWFNGVTFHRVIPGFAAQAGDPSGTGRGNPGYLFKNEISDLKFDKPGLVGMANSGPDTNGSQFFITFVPAPHLDGRYTLFGEVLSGLDVAEKLTPRDPDKDPSLPSGDKILSVDIEEK